MATQAAPIGVLAQPAVPPAIAPRVDSVDLWRGAIMIIMALDHVRDYFTNFPLAPEDVMRTWPTLFFTRWITHFCAPWFCFLAGTGAYLAMSRGRSLSQMQSLLLKRGLWLIVLEQTVLIFGWTFIFPVPIALVLWMLGLSMICLAAVVKLPVKWIAAIGIAMIALHNFTDPIKPAAFGSFGWLWTLLHVQGVIGDPRHLLFGKIPAFLFVAYPLIPWPGVMAAGYAFGAVMRKPVAERRRILLALGTACIALFILLRATNLYGNPHTPSFTTDGNFVPQSRPIMSVVDFLDTEKYPPSLDFLLMTLGPGFLLLAAFDKLRADVAGYKSRLARFVVLYGRVPMFYYVLHIYLIHITAIVVALAVGQPWRWLMKGGFFVSQPPPAYGHGLTLTYAVWIAVVLLLYFPCRWFAQYKRTHRQWWLSYI